MEGLIAKLVKAADEIKDDSSSDIGSTATAQYESCHDVLQSLLVEVRQARTTKRMDQRLAQHQEQRLCKVIPLLMKTLRARKRSSLSNTPGTYDLMMSLAQELLTELTLSSKGDGKPSIDDKKERARLATAGLPSSVQEYKTRLQKHKKELYKSPPILPPKSITIADVTVVPTPPQRDPVSKRLSFFMPYENCCSSDMKTEAAEAALIIGFHPNVTPDEVLLGGAFGGTYFRSIHSAVTNVQYVGKDVIASTIPQSWLAKFDKNLISTQLTSTMYRNSVNKFKVQCGGSLGMWEVRWLDILLKLFSLNLFYSITNHDAISLLLHDSLPVG
jgi:hypothetical protein